MSIKFEHIFNIVSRRKYHEHRIYLLSSSVRHIWFYITDPLSFIRYVARILNGKVSDQVSEDDGIGNEDFNAGRKVPKYVYEILEPWELKRSISLQQSKAKGFLKVPPQQYCWVPQTVIEAHSLREQLQMFTIEEKPSAKKKKISDFFEMATRNE